jgi:hypothetical protein
VAFTGTLGTQAYADFKGLDFGYNVAGYYKFDEQVLLGVQSGQGVAGDGSAVPLLGAAYMRLPIGRVVMPVATASVGYVLADSASGFLWRAGGLFDIRNGKRSSLLLGAEYEGHDGRSGLAFRGGLLLEF